MLAVRITYAMWNVFQIIGLMFRCDGFKHGSGDLILVRINPLLKHDLTSLRLELANEV